MWQPRHWAAFLVVASAFSYAVVRYHILKGVPWSEFPLYISNKAFALAAVGLIALSYLLGSLVYFFPRTFGHTLSARKFFGLFGFGLAAVHSVISLLIFNAAYYPKFFEASGKLNLTGESSLLFGVASLMFFSVVAITSLPSIANSLGHERWVRFQHLGYWGFIAVAGHVFVMGIKGWLDVASWPGGLLPISLVAFIVILAALLLRALTLLSRNLKG